ncbi:ATP-binding protein [Pontibacter ruber]|uniref:histidine kinase n=1 Tax=Pontibacter ruber TaxID=1343895 RepID=A0ABW5CUB0_9BACT|nr:ATP-binding protein [Pontibacter ruber]
MSRNILKININNELDVVLAYKRAKQLSERLGIAMGSQTKFATAVSEICRNVVEHVGSGQIVYGVMEEAGIHFLQAIVSDRGRGIGNIDQLLNRSIGTALGKGTGILNSRKLVDYFHIESEFEKGTRVTLRIRLPHNAPTVTKSVAEAWTYEFDQDAYVSPYAEIKRQNMQLLELLEQLRERNQVVQQKLQENRLLNEKLQQSNNDIRELLKERDLKNAQLERTNKDLDDFAHTVSHDLRAPLQNINALAVVLEACLESENIEEAKEIFPMLREQALKMDQLVLGILSYSLAGRHNIPKTKTDVQELLYEIIGLLQIPKGMRIEIQHDLPVLETERIYLQQVFSNLIGNAIKYHDNPAEGLIQIQYTQHADWLQFVVQDNGPGISRDNQQRIFEMFEALGQDIVRSDSTGIGLSLVRKIVRNKGGDCWVQSEGRGSRFVFTWPAKEMLTFA